MKRWWLPLVVAAGLALRVWPWFLPHAFLGVLEQDDGVYYGAAKLLLHGQLPYRDVTIVHPPGSALLLAPFAALGGLLGDPVGMAAARVAVLAVAAANTVLVHGLARRVPGCSEAGALLAAAAYALIPNAVAAEHTVLLEPMVNLACLLAVGLLTKEPTRAAVAGAGVLLALGVSIKLFAAAYVLVAIAWFLHARRPGQLIPLSVGLAAGAGLFLGPFVAGAPGAFWQDVVVTQAARPQGSGRAHRLLDVVGLGPLPVAVAIPCVLLLAYLIAWHARGSASPPYRLWAEVFAVSWVAFLTSSTYFPHYAAFLAPALAILLSQSRPALVALVLVAFLAGSVIDDSKARGQGDLAQAGSLIPPGSCVFYEHASVAIAVDRFTPPTPDCPAWLDGRGLLYSRSTGWPRGEPFYFRGFTENEQWQAELRGQLEHADVLLIKAAPDRIPEWSAQTQAYAQGHFRRLARYPGPGHAQVEVWVRR